MDRILRPEDISLPKGYRIEVFAEKLTTPINLTFTDHAEILIADAGITTGNGKVLLLTSSGPKVIADGFKPPLTGITFYHNNIYVAHRWSNTMVKSNGSKASRFRLNKLKNQLNNKPNLPRNVKYLLSS